MVTAGVCLSFPYNFELEGNWSVYTSFLETLQRADSQTWYYIVNSQSAMTG